MPNAALTPCNHPGCGVLSSARYCGSHTKKETRKSAHARGYDYRWSKLSAMYRRENPLCEMHLVDDKYVPVQLVDHIVPLHVAPDRCYDESNLQGLCRDCHAEKTEADILVYGSATTHRARQKPASSRGRGG